MCEVNDVQVAKSTTISHVVFKNKKDQTRTSLSEHTISLIYQAWENQKLPVWFYIRRWFILVNQFGLIDTKTEQI